MKIFAKNVLAGLLSATVLATAAALPARAIGVDVGGGVGIGAGINVGPATPVQVNASTLNQVQAQAGQQVLIRNRSDDKRLDALIRAQGSVLATVTEMNGDTATARLSDGTSISFDVSDSMARRLSVGDSITIIERGSAFLVARTIDVERNAAEFGRISAMNGTAIAVQLTNGTTAHVTVAPQLVSRFSVGERVVLVVKQGQLMIAEANGVSRDQTLTGRITAITGDLITVQLSNGTYATVAASDDLIANAIVGQTVRLVRHGGRLSIAQSAQLAQATQVRIGRVTRISGTRVSVQLNTGNAAIFRVSSGNVARLMVNERVRIITRAGVTTMVPANGVAVMNSR